MAPIASDRSSWPVPWIDWAENCRQDASDMRRAACLALLLCFVPFEADAQVSAPWHATVSFAVLEGQQRHVVDGTVESRWPRGWSIDADRRILGPWRASVNLLGVYDSQARRSDVLTSSTHSAMGGLQLDLVDGPRARAFVEGLVGLAILSASYGDEGDAQNAGAVELTAGAELYPTTHIGVRVVSGYRRTNRSTQLKLLAGWA